MRNFAPYIVVGSVAWLALHESGVHATLAGVILGLMTPAKTVLIPERFREYLQNKKESFENQRWALRRQRTAVVKEVQLRLRLAKPSLRWSTWRRPYTRGVLTSLCRSSRWPMRACPSDWQYGRFGSVGRGARIGRGQAVGDRAF